MTQAGHGHAERMAFELEQVRRDLGGRVPADVLDRAIDETVRELDAARIKDFVPVLLHQTVRRRVRGAVPAQR